MHPDVVTALIVAGASMLTGLGSYFAGRRQRKEARKQIESDTSGDHRIAELADSRQFRQDLSTELKEMRDESRKLRDEIRDQATTCEQKIDEAIQRESESCDEKITAKLRSQAAILRREFREQLTETSEASG